MDNYKTILMGMMISYACVFAAVAGAYYQNPTAGFATLNPLATTSNPTSFSSNTNTMTKAFNDTSLNTTTANAQGGGNLLQTILSPFESFWNTLVVYGQLLKLLVIAVVPFAYILTLAAAETQPIIQFILFGITLVSAWQNGLAFLAVVNLFRRGN